jgi:hypothetical protein
MLSTESKNVSATVPRALGHIISSLNIDWIKHWLFLAPALLIVLIMITGTWGQDAQSTDEYDQLNPEGLQQIHRIGEAMHKVVKISIIVGLVLLAIMLLRMIAPMTIIDNIEKKRLANAVKEVETLLERIHAEVERTASDDQAGDQGVLAGMMGVTESGGAEDVPSYVLTVNDIMLDNIMSALTRLRRMRMAKAAQYRDYMFTVLNGIKIITEQCEATRAASSLAVNCREYFAEDWRYNKWKNLLGAYAKRGNHREAAQIFLLFMKNLKGSQPLTITPRASAKTKEVEEAPTEKMPEIPDILLEENLPRLQQAAQEEAGHLVDLIQADRPGPRAHAWQFELVRRQQQPHLRDEAKKMLRIFLRDEKKALQKITKTKMLPCKTWDHILYMLGVENTDQLHKRVEQKLFTGQEIIILEKAFLQTFAKRGALQRIYGQDKNAGIMMDLHIPLIRSETLVLLHQIHQSERQDLDHATELLDEDETPQRHEVARLIKHFIHHGHLPPGLES